MFNKKGESKMNNPKLDIIKKVMMLDTRLELQNVLNVVGNSISRELDKEDKDQAEFAEWKASKGVAND